MTSHIDKSPWPPVVKCANAVCTATVPERGMFCPLCQIQQRKELQYLRAKKAALKTAGITLGCWLLASSAFAGPGSFSASIAVNAAGTFADLYTTKMALDAGAHESFGALQGGGMGRIVSLRVTTAGIFTIAQVLLDKHGHPTAARWFGIGAGGAGFAAAVHNVQVARRLR